MSLSGFYHRLAVRATPRALAGGVLLWLVSALGIVALQSRVAALSGGLPLPDFHPFYTPTSLYGLLEQYGVSARKAFLHFTIYDFYYPFVAYGVASLALASLIRSFIDAHPRLVWVLVVPLAGLAAELMEQVCLLLILSLFPAKVFFLAVIASASTLLKFALILVLVSSLAGLGLCRLALLVRGPTRRCR